MKQDWNSHRDTLHAHLETFEKLSPDVMGGVMTISGAAAKSGKLEPKVHSLIALAVAVTTRCDGCISVHTQRAADAGATLEEITEALGVAIALNAGAALTYSTRVLDAYQQLPGK